MPLGHAEAGDNVSNAIRKLDELWRTVGYTNDEDGQQVKNPTDDEKKLLAELTKEVTDSVSALGKAK